MKKLILAAAISSAYFFPMLAQADSNATTGAANSNVVARLDFQIVIPAVLQLRVGSVGSATTNIDLITFSPTVANLGDGTLPTPTGGDAGAGAVNVRLVANNAAGNVNLTSITTVGGLSTGVGTDSTIPWSQIGVTASVGAPAHPTFVPAGGTSVVFSNAAAATRIVNLTGTWTYRYLNTIVPSSGTYGATAQGAGAGVNGGRVLYTASQV
jgi:hypothetical protein